MKPGDLVKVHKDGFSVFTVLRIDEEDGTALVESAVDAPGKYPWPTPLGSLVPVEQ
ncbi:hypothetical protein [Rhodococcus artemisiae]|uniref:Uncharacterized protein n=1 Tax=Rhodococcus artemisiae TaxID=714159 RepID=A0ABU7LJY9_9NOCA|nr:hypothetical protein [Rhodococcus artemisiae]MEE2061559.1 hypothetical protein [Rhodococcus artemisiae]